MKTSIPVYHADGCLYAHVDERRLERLQAAGLVARLVRHRKGHINRAILFIRSDGPRSLSASSYTGTRYSFQEHLEHGPSWRLKVLSHIHHGKM